MFNLNYIAASLGVNIESGGLSVIEEELKVSGARGNVTLSQEAVPFDGSMIVWYKKRGEEDDAYVIGTVTGGKTVSIPDSQEDDVYCVKYFYMNPNAKSIQIPTQYVPATLHVVIINDLYAGDIVDVGSANKYGRLITDIPRLQMDGEVFKFKVA